MGSEPIKRQVEAIPRLNMPARVVRIGPVRGFAMTPRPTAAATTGLAAPRRGRRYFTVEQANAALVYVTRIVDDVTTTYAAAVEVRQRIEQPHVEDSVEMLRDQYEELMDRLNEYLDELHQVGVELKDFEKGLLDFPAVHQGREILLCWMRGEKKIRSWHEIDTGYSGRQDVATLEH